MCWSKDEKVFFFFYLLFSTISKCKVLLPNFKLPLHHQLKDICSFVVAMLHAKPNITAQWRIIQVEVVVAGHLGTNEGIQYFLVATGLVQIVEQVG